MILTGHQPAYLPWLGLFHKIALADKFIFLDTVQYLKKEFDNRNKIKGPNGPLWLTVPVYSKEKFDQKLNEVKINNEVDWRKKHWISITTAYKKALYFKDYSNFFEEIYSREWGYLVDLNRQITKHFLKELGINTQWVEAKDLDLKGTKSDLVLDMCKKTNADIYIFGEMGQNYAEKEKFEQEKVDILFQKYNHPTYPQQFKGFDSHLSILDLLFNCGPKSFKILMENNISKEDILKQCRQKERGQE